MFVFIQHMIKYDNNYMYVIRLRNIEALLFIFVIQILYIQCTTVNLKSSGPGEKLQIIRSSNYPKLDIKMVKSLLYSIPLFQIAIDTGNR